MAAIDFYLVTAMNMQTGLFSNATVFQDFVCTCFEYVIDIACCFQVSFTSLYIYFI